MATLPSDSIKRMIPESSTLACSLQWRLEREMFFPNISSVVGNTQEKLQIRPMGREQDEDQQQTSVIDVECVY